jgi:hypothetical protein
VWDKLSADIYLSVLSFKHRDLAEGRGARSVLADETARGMQSHFFCYCMEATLTRYLDADGLPIPAALPTVRRLKISTDKGGPPCGTS